MNCKRLQVGLSFVLLLLIARVAPAQEFRATLSGRVLDPSQAAIAGAVVQARNAQTNEVSSATSDAQGLYTIPFMRPGTYALTAEATGFKKFSQDNVVLQVGQQGTVNIHLEV